MEETYDASNYEEAEPATESNWPPPITMHGSGTEQVLCVKYMFEGWQELMRSEYIHAYHMTSGFEFRNKEDTETIFIPSGGGIIWKVIK